ncbi:Mco32p NDAI_0D04120 [Naumovozyma dairenensis CBS 421]|uniref:Uncharacterized protein n=1 Tax=Naumovozyma dairenensis (strain ATCC 10597 / BCRC 20456 / CBS 421 / NBRC 0211 / NRRL Y-12639) TaxID=1071378 RepID=G0WAB5_NAUDC|nr:hypothetical protein NDAI_0D04120 [Naumovozyma dairenensis CBS 421]CCD24726.1 hypothetical protein NDAI_0D04120 [Naumovozyma dairenensis CBS 421]
MRIHLPLHYYVFAPALRRQPLNVSNDLLQGKCISLLYLQKRPLSDDHHANLGTITKYLTVGGIPNLLQKSIDDKYLCEDVQLRLLPTIYPYIPTIHGRSKYNASLNAIRLIVRNFILSEKCRLHILSVQTVLSKSTLEKNANFKFITNHDKLIVKWQTCLSEDDCKTHKLENMKSTKLAGKNAAADDDESTSHIVDYILDPSKGQLNENIVSKHFQDINLSVAEDKEDGEASGEREIKEQKPKKISKLLKGIQIFEFNEDNTKIQVHTFENIEMINFEKKIDTGGAFAC